MKNQYIVFVPFRPLVTVMAYSKAEVRIAYPGSTIFKPGDMPHVSGHLTVRDLPDRRLEAEVVIDEYFSLA